MNRKKAIDYTVPRRPKDRVLYNFNSSKPRSDSSRDQRDRGDGGRDKTPFWSKDDKNLMFDKRKETIPVGEHDLRRDGVLKSLQEEISRAVLSQDANDDSSLFARGNEDNYPRGATRGPIIDEFSEDMYNLQSGSNSKRMDFRDSKDQQRRKTDDRSARKRSYSPIDEKSSSYRKGRGDTPTKHSHTTSSKSGSRNDDDDLRNVLKQFQKSKWDDDNASTPDRKRYDRKDYDDKRDRSRNKDSLEVSTSSDMFTMSSQGTLGSLPLEPLSDTRDYFEPGSGRDYRDEDCQKGYKGLYSDSAKDRDGRDSRDYSRSRYRSSKQDRRGSLDDGQRGLSSDVDSRDSRYRMDKRDSLDDRDLEPSLDRYGEASNLGSSRLSSDALRDLPLSELTQKSSQKYKTGFELGRPFFGFSSDHQKKEEDTFVDFVSILNQYCQKNRLNTPKYDDAPGVQGGYGVQVYVKGQKFTSVKYCLTKKEARHDAAKSALLSLDVPAGLQDPVFGGEPKSYSKGDQRDGRGNSHYKDNMNDNSKQPTRGSSKTVSKSNTTPPSLPENDKSKGSTLNTQKPGPKPLFPSGFLPRQLQKPIGKGVQKAGVDLGMEPPPLPKKGGYFPKNMENSRSRSRSSERDDSKKEVGISNSSSKREVKPPSKGKFTTQNWSGLENNGNRQQSIEKDSFTTSQPQGRGRGRGNMNANNRGRGAVFNLRGRGRGFRGRGFRGRGVSSGDRGRGTMTHRGRGFVFRGRGRGMSQPPVGATVRNIFRRSRSPSPVGSKYRKPSRSPRSPRRDSKSRSERRKERRSRSRSRSSSFCSTCSSHSCSTCHSWRSVSLDSLSGKGDGGKKKHHTTKISSKEDKEKNSAKALDKLKSDIKSMEKQLDKKPVKGVEEKKKSDSKGSREPKKATEVSKTEVKEKAKADKAKDKPGSSKDPLVVKDKKDNNFREVKKEVRKEFKTEVKKKTDTVREVILKSDKRKESPLMIKKEKVSPVREVKIVNEKKTKGGKGDEKSGSKMKIDTLKITIDQPEKTSESKKDTKKDKKKENVEEKPEDSGKRSSKSPSGKPKKKEKVKTKKAKKKAKKRKYDRDSEDSGDESIYSSISGQDEFSGNDDKLRSLQAPHDERIVEFSSSGAFDTNSISAHYAKMGAGKYHVTGRKSSEGDALQNHPSRKNLISIPVAKGPGVIQKSNILQHARRPRPIQQQIDYPLNKEEQDEKSSDAQYSDVSLPNESSFENVDWETAKFAGECETESAVGEQDFGTSYQGSEILNQEWTSEQGEVGDPNSYYYEEGTEGGEYEQEYYYPQEGDWQTGDQGGDQGEYQEWYEGEYPQEGAEGEAGAVYEGEYYLAEDGLYYPVEGEAYQESQDYQGEYVEGGTEGEAVYAGQDAAYAEGDYQYQYSEEGGEWQQYDEAAVYQTEEGWNQGEAEGQWQEEYQEGYQEGYHGTESEWGNEYTQGNEFEAGGQGYAVEGTEMLPQEGYNAVEGYDQQLPAEQLPAEEYYMETVPPQGESHHVEHGFQPQQQENVMEPEYSQEPLTSKNESKEMPVAPTKTKVEENKPLKSILKKAKPVEENGKGSKLVSERLAQMRKQSANKVEIPQRGSTSAPSVESVKKQDQNPDQDPDQNPSQEGAESVQSESDRYREMEEAILSSQPKDAVGTEYVVRVHGSGTANFYCKLCRCHFNTLTAKNLHIKGMKHIELYIRLKSSLLQSVIRDTKVETAKRPAEDDPQAVQKVPRRL
ncbi:uncharacterized protein LOC144651638 isoform X2 [Oculina patagonica]